MLISKEVTFKVSCANYIKQLNLLNIKRKKGDIVTINIKDLWIGSTIKVLAKCEICQNNIEIQYNTYNSSIKKYNIFTCSRKCSTFKRKLTKLEKYGNENFNNREKCSNTLYEKYNVINVSQLENVKLKKN